jgi:hypothetical protein
VKQRQGLLPGSQSFFDGFWAVVGPGYWRNPMYWPHLALAGVGLGYTLRCARRWLVVLFWGLLYFAAYSWLGVTRYFWYYAPLVPGFVVLVALGVEVVMRAVRRSIAPQWATGLATLLVLFLLLPHMLMLNDLRRNQDPRLVIYRQVGEWLRTETPPDASVGTLEVGVIGYYAQRRMVDFGGLIQPEVALRFTSQSSYEQAAIWAVEHFDPDYLVLHDGIFPHLEQIAIASAGCQHVQRFSHPTYKATLSVYDCRASQTYQGQVLGSHVVRSRASSMLL